MIPQMGEIVYFCSTNDALFERKPSGARKPLKTLGEMGSLGAEITFSEIASKLFIYI